MAGPRRNRSDPPRVCSGCKFGVGVQRDCSLIQASRLETLLEEGPCQFGRRVKAAVARSVAENFPEARRVAQLFGEKAVFRIQMLNDFPGEELARLPEVMLWLDRFALRFVAELLENHDDIDGLQCGRCRSFDADRQRCGREFVEGPQGRLDPHPWFDRDLSGETDPLRLDPVCAEFEGRAATDADPLEAILGGLEEGDRAHTVLLAIDRLAEASMTGMAQAVFIQRHLIRGEALEKVATAAGLEVEPARRVLRAARTALLQILEEDAPTLVEEARARVASPSKARS